MFSEQRKERQISFKYLCRDHIVLKPEFLPGNSVYKLQAPILQKQWKKVFLWNQQIGRGEYNSYILVKIQKKIHSSELFIYPTQIIFLISEHHYLKLYIHQISQKENAKKQNNFVVKKMCNLKQFHINFTSKIICLGQ